MFKQFLTYKHLSCLDMVIYVNKVTYRGPRYWKLKVTYLARGNILGSEAVKVKKEDFDHWRKYEV